MESIMLPLDALSIDAGAVASTGEQPMQTAAATSAKRRTIGAGMQAKE